MGSRHDELFPGWNSSVNDQIMLAIMMETYAVRSMSLSHRIPPLRLTDHYMCTA